MSDDTQTLQETPLRSTHEALGGKLVPFAGWRMPVQYAGVLPEHEAVRTKAGVFDISHMGQFIVEGPGSTAWLDSLLTNRVAKLGIGEGQYSLMLNEQGGVIDDLILYRIGEESYFLVVNASMIPVDFAWLEKHLEPGIVLIDESHAYAGMAVQGPESAAIFQKIFPEATLPPRNGVSEFTADGEELIVCRTGYTGEDGFEFFCSAAHGGAWFLRFIEAGAVPCGLGARDSLRLEMAYPLNGSDLSPSRTPLEAGLGFFVDLEKKFTGSDVLVQQKAAGLPARLVCLRMLEKGAPPRAHYPVLADGNVIGEICSGGPSPSLGCGIAMAYLPPAHGAVGTRLEVDVRGRRWPAEVVKKPFYRRPAAG